MKKQVRYQITLSDALSVASFKRFIDENVKTVLEKHQELKRDDIQVEIEPHGLFLIFWIDKTEEELVVSEKRRTKLYEEISSETPEI